jgi:hypothetical protein
MGRISPEGNPMSPVEIRARRDPVHRIAAALSLALAFGFSPHAAGIRYTGSVRTEGGPVASDQQKEAMKKMGMAEDRMDFDFDVLAQSGRVRENFLSGFAFFQKGDYMLADSLTKTAYLVMPRKKEYVPMGLAGVQNVGELLQASMKKSYSDQEADVEEIPPKVVNGYPCTGKKVRLAYTLTASATGTNTKIRVEETTEYYSTAQFETLIYFGNMTWHKQGLATGDEEFDRVIAARVGALGFPVEIRTHKVVDGMERGTTVLSIKDVQTAPTVAPGTFSVPTGFTRTTLETMRMTGAHDAQDAKGVEGMEAPPQGTPSREKIAKPMGNKGT